MSCFLQERCWQSPAKHQQRAVSTAAAAAAAAVRMQLTATTCHNRTCVMHYDEQLVALNASTVSKYSVSQHACFINRQGLLVLAKAPSAAAGYTQNP
jgi:hypothetical protein